MNVQRLLAVAASVAALIVVPRNAGASRSTLSAKTRMVCSDETRKNFSAAVGLPTTTTPPTWSPAGTYHCVFVLAGAPLDVTVVQASSRSAAHVAYRHETAALRPSPDPLTIGDEATVATDGRIVVRRDEDVLVVDPRRLPETLGPERLRRDIVAEDLVEVILDCWH